ncbi:hypothetical protein [Azospirillum palustre]
MGRPGDRQGGKDRRFPADAKACPPRGTGCRQNHVPHLCSLRRFIGVETRKSVPDLSGRARVRTSIFP